LFPTIAPYRDAGEMTTVIHTLGVAHPPGYPLYTLLGKIFVLLVPFGNIAYRINVLSAVFGALTVAVIARAITRLDRPAGQARLDNKNSPVLRLVAFLLAFSYLQWYLSLVSEMYTLNTLFAAVIFLIIILKLTGESQSSGHRNDRFFYLVVFLLALGLGNRMDLVLFLPGFLYILWINTRKKTGPPQIRFTRRPPAGYLRFGIILSFFFLLGLSVYFYLPVRSTQNPLIDWNHPAGLDKLWSTLTRKTHGKTLDLLSIQYAKGENFLAGLIFYFKHLFSGFAYLGFPVGVLGLWAMFKRNITFAITTVLCFIFSGIWFIYTANMPPNPHALAVLEAHFLMPNLLYIFWIGAGASEVIRFLKSRSFLKILAVALMFIAVIFNVIKHLPCLNKRHNFFAYDYSSNVMRSVETDSIVVLKEDVQLFSMWFCSHVLKKRSDITIIAQGLAGSGWYQDMLAGDKRDVYVGRLRDKTGWEEFADRNKGKDIFFSGDVEFQRPEKYGSLPYGLVTLLSADKPTYASAHKSAGKTGQEKVVPGETLLNDIYIYRGEYNYDAYREFFTPDLIEEYAKARHKLGYHYMINKNYESAQKEYFYALTYKRNFPTVAYQLGYVYFSEGKYSEAERAYLNAKELYEYTLELAKKYHSLPGVFSGLKSELAEVCLHLGVASERLNKEKDAMDYYSEAIRHNPDFANAYFNRAVVYWRRADWSNVVKELTIALKIAPDYKEARYYLEEAKKHLNQ
jgi:hypothetical protein